MIVICRVFRIWTRIICNDYDYEPYVYEPHKRVRDSIIRFSFDLDDYLIVRNKIYYLFLECLWNI